MAQSALIFTALLGLAFVLAASHSITAPLGTADSVKKCHTQEIFERRRGNQTANTVFARSSLAKCPTEGTCDDPATRAKSPQGQITVRAVVHIFQNSAGKAPDGLTIAAAVAAIDELNQAYEPYAVNFEVTDYLQHQDNRFYCIAPFSQYDDQWQVQVDALKKQYAVTPSKYLNIFATCQTRGDEGTLLGFGTFPWDSAWSTSLGGVWMNSLAMGKGQKTLIHEMGHNLGLWHTFHGVSEMQSCNDPCFENAHAFLDPAADVVGDFCSDTPATPLTYDCANPTSRDCKSQRWGATDFSNYMSYSGDDCMDHFTDDQRERIHCWACSRLSGLLTSAC